MFLKLRKMNAKKQRLFAYKIEFNFSNGDFLEYLKNHPVKFQICVNMIEQLLLSFSKQDILINADVSSPSAIIYWQAVRIMEDNITRTNEPTNTFVKSLYFAISDISKEKCSQSCPVLRSPLPSPLQRPTPASHLPPRGMAILRPPVPSCC